MASKQELSEEEKPEDLLRSDQKGIEEKKETSETNLDDTNKGNDTEASETDTCDKNDDDDNSGCVDQSSLNAVLNTAISSISKGSDGHIDTSDKDSNDENSKCVDESSPRTVLDTPVSGNTDSIGSSSSSSSSGGVPFDDQSVESNHSLQWKNMISGLLKRKKSSMIRVVTFPPRTKSTGFQRCLERMRSGKGARMECSSVIAPEVIPEIGKWRPSWRSFDYEELAAATDGFSPENLIGKGGHAEVYKGRLADGQLIAVKRLTKGGDKEDRVSDFLSELGIIAHVNHSNAAQLLGFSVEGGLHLVLQFSPHGSLASVLHGSKKCLEWKVRLKIAIGIAEGLVYLHEGCHRRIIHRDIKASNILLTDDYQPQISDFGLAKWLPDKWSHHVVFPIEGTFGYMAPEYFMHGVINEKTDVFAFGVLLLELVTGRKAVDSSRQSLVIWAKPLLDSNNMKELVDPSLSDVYNAEEIARVLAVASMCIHHISSIRPNMKLVVRLLKDKEGSVELIVRPKVMKPLMFDACDSEDYTRSSYLNDLHRHKQLALEQ